MPGEIHIAAFTGAQLRAARALLGWTTQRLAMESGASLATIRRAEFGAGSFQAGPAVAARIVSAVDAAGVIFTASKGRGVGVAFKHPAGAAHDTASHGAFFDAGQVTVHLPRKIGSLTKHK